MRYSGVNGIMVSMIEGMVLSKQKQRRNKMIVRTQKNLVLNKRNKRLKNRIQPKQSKKKFECRIITNPVELMEMGYDPSQKTTPMNDQEVSEVLKLVA